jgi:Leucine-rich repeat (LRR) protein
MKYLVLYSLIALFITVHSHGPQSPKPDDYIQLLFINKGLLQAPPLYRYDGPCLLELGQNNLINLPEYYLNNVPFLDYLSLNNNFFLTMPDLKTTLYLEVLDMSNNYLEEIESDTFLANPLLRMVYLGNNNIKSLPPNLFRNNKELTSINISGNPICLSLNQAEAKRRWGIPASCNLICLPQPSQIRSLLALDAPNR